MNGDKEIRELAKSFLRERKTSVSSLARISGVSQTTINDQLNGNAKIGMQTIVALLDAFPDLSAEWLLRGEGEMLRTNGCDIVINNSNSHHNNNNAGNGTQIIGSDIEVW